MQPAGTALHLARSGRLIVKAESQVRDGTLLLDDKGRRTGRVMETIGSVYQPFLSVQPMTDRVERIIGKELFFQTDNPRESISPGKKKYRGKRDRPCGKWARRAQRSP